MNTFDPHFGSNFKGYKGPFAVPKPPVEAGLTQQPSIERAKQQDQRRDRVDLGVVVIVIMMILVAAAFFIGVMFGVYKTEAEAVAVGVGTLTTNANVVRFQWNKPDTKVTVDHNPTPDEGVNVSLSRAILTTNWSWTGHVWPGVVLWPGSEIDAHYGINGRFRAVGTNFTYGFHAIRWRYEVE